MGCRLTQHGRHRERPRCTGAAIEAALRIASFAQAARAEAAAAAADAPDLHLDMSRAAALTDARLLVITSGPTTKVRFLTHEDTFLRSHTGVPHPAFHPTESSSGLALSSVWHPASDTSLDLFLSMLCYRQNGKIHSAASQTSG